MKNIVLAVTSRVGKDPNHTGSERIYVAKEFIDIFDELNVTLVPMFKEKDIQLIDICDGLLIPGSYSNVDPKYYGGQKLDNVDYGSNEYELDSKIIKAFLDQDKPILAICAGIQEINVYFGGTLKQNLLNHCNDELHNISIDKDSYLYDCYKKEKMDVNTLHYQAIDKVAPNFKISAISDDNIIEAIEKDKIIAVQWHPELMHDISFFKYFIDNMIK